MSFGSNAGPHRQQSAPAAFTLNGRFWIMEPFPTRRGRGRSGFGWLFTCVMMLGVVAEIRLAEALVVVDVQVAFVSGAGAVPAAEPLAEAIVGLVARARAVGAVVIHLQNDGPAGAVDEPGTPGWELYLPVHEGADEVVIRKTGDDGFDGTDLGGLLHRRGVRRLAICGVMSEMCVSATARAALQLGFGVVLPHDAHATYDVPAAPDISDVVPAAVASRVAEWALGDGIDIVARAAAVDFVAADTAPVARPILGQ